MICGTFWGEYPGNGAVVLPLDAMREWNGLACCDVLRSMLPEPLESGRETSSAEPGLCCWIGGERLRVGREKFSGGSNRPLTGSDCTLVRPRLKRSGSLGCVG
jgi:hypothetical protein